MSTNDYERFWGERINTGAYSEPLAVLMAAFPTCVFARNETEARVHVPVLGTGTLFTVPIADVYDEEWHRNKLAKAICDVAFIGQRLLAVGAQTGAFTATPLLTPRSRGVRVPRSAATAAPYELTLERLVELVAVQLNIDVSKLVLQVKPMAPRRGKGRFTAISGDMFRCHIVHGTRRANASICCTTIELAQKQALIHLLVGLTKLN